MKKITAVLLIPVFVAALLSACALLPGNEPAASSQPAATAAPAVSSADAATDAPPVTDAPAAPTDAPVGTLNDYVRTAKEASYTFDSGDTKVYRVPEILLDSRDASAANTEIMERFGEDVKEYTDYSPVTALDYEAYLNDKYLSVIVTGKYDGGNSYGLCYTFDVTTGDELNSETLCAMTGRDYDTILNTLTTNLTSYYDEHYSTLPGNDTEKSKTLDSANIRGAKLYLDSSGNLMALTDIYAAVGGGQWIVAISAE